LESTGTAFTLHKNVVLGRYLTTQDLRDRTILGDWDVAYNYTRRLRPNSLSVDAGAPDRGVEANTVSLEDFIHPISKAGLKVSTSYNLAQAPELSPPLTVATRFAPFAANLYVLPSQNINIVSNASYQDGQGLQNVTAQADYGRPGNNHFGMGISKYKSTANQTQLSNDFGFWPKMWGWSLEGTTYYQVGGGVTAKFSSVNLTLRRTWHDFEGQVGVISRVGGVLEYSVNFRLRFRQAGAPPITHSDWEQEWYPWRNPLIEH
jgi:hypothetical protein